MNARAESRALEHTEREWIPYFLVAGEKERGLGSLTVRIRRDKSQREMSLAALLVELKHEQGDLPFRPLSTPHLLSRKPIFFG